MTTKEQKEQKETYHGPELLGEILKRVLKEFTTNRNLKLSKAIVANEQSDKEV